MPSMESKIQSLHPAGCQELELDLESGLLSSLWNSDPDICIMDKGSTISPVDIMCFKQARNKVRLSVVVGGFLFFLSSVPFYRTTK